MTLISLQGIRSPPCDLLIVLGDPNHSQLLGVLTLNLQCSGLPSRLVGFGEESALNSGWGFVFTTCTPRRRYASLLLRRPVERAPFISSMSEHKFELLAMATCIPFISFLRWVVLLVVLVLVVVGHRLVIDDRRGLVFGIEAIEASEDVVG